jgi:hypothetical protein
MRYTHLVYIRIDIFFVSFCWMSLRLAFKRPMIYFDFIVLHHISLCEGLRCLRRRLRINQVNKLTKSINVEIVFRVNQLPTSNLYQDLHVLCVILLEVILFNEMVPGIKNTFIVLWFHCFASYLSKCKFKVFNKMMKNKSNKQAR